MHIPTPESKRATSRLLEQFHGPIGVSSTGRVGFRSQATAPRRSIGVVVQLMEPSAALLKAALAANVDGVAFEVRAAADLEHVVMLVQDARAPFGLVLASSPAEQLVQRSSQSAADWLCFSLDVSVSVLTGDKARFVSVPLDIDVRTASSLNGALCDAVVVPLTAAGERGVVLGDVLKLRLLAEVVRKPLLVTVQAGHSVPLPALLHDVGVDGVQFLVAGADSLPPVLRFMAQVDADDAERLK